MASSSSSGVMASAGAIGSSFDVFLSFRGEDTRHSFTDHLYEALNRAGINAFRDNEGIERGEEVTSEIERAIKGSSASIVVISENYARSTWCLDELVLILEQRRECNHFVLPIFYHVEPTDVGKQNNTFAIEVGTSSRWTEENVNRWKRALKLVAKVAGMVVSRNESEYNFLKKIVNKIYDKLDFKPVHLPPNVIGMTIRYEEICSSWLNQSNPSSRPSSLLAICGMSGSGKTTLAKYIFNLNWKKYEIVSFLENIGSRCKEPNGLLQLQEQLLKDILGGIKQKTPRISRGTRTIQEALKSKKVLIVLDDITEISQLFSLLGTREIHSQLKIIITTQRNTNTWFEWTIKKYEMKLLNNDESLKLLSHHAFHTGLIPEDFDQNLVLQALEYCEGNPLALEVLGSSLSINNSISSWKSRLNLLGKDLDSRVQDVLERSYMSLPYDCEKQLFLHIACFFIGQDMDYVEKILEPDYSAISGIKILIDRSLLSVSPNNKLTMHRLLQEMGKNIVRQESKFPAKRSRVWLSNDSYKILSKGKGSETIEGLALDIHALSEAKSAFKSSGLNTKALKEMENLKLLQLNFAELNGSYENISEDLRWLCWHGFHLATIPSDLYIENLVALDMSYSKLQVFEPPTVLRSLQIVNLKDSYNLLEIRNISRIPHLEILILWNCYSLNHVCKSIEDLTRLALLHMTGCKNLWKRELEASTSSGVTMPAFSFPRSLSHLFLKDCDLESTNSFPLSFDVQPCLQYLNLVNGLFEALPYNDHLNNLRVLDLSLCSKLTCLLCLPSTLAELYIYYCESLEKITFQSHRFTLQEFGYEGCINLTEVEGFIKLVPLANLHETDLGHMKWLKGYQNLEVCLTGDDELTIGRSLHIQMLYEFNIVSVSLPDIMDPSMTPFISESPFLSFEVPSCPKNKRLKGLNVSFKYTTLRSIPCDEWAWFCKIHTSNGLDLMYNPKIYGKPEFGRKCIWLSYWPIGKTLGVRDKVDVSIVVSGLDILECGVSLVYTDDEVGKGTMESNIGWVDILGVDLSRFQLSKGVYYLCRRDFYELMEAGRLTPSLLSNIVGDTFDYTEVRGWRKSGRQKQVNPSFTELKTVRCIIDGPELEDIYRIPEMSKSSLAFKPMASTSSLLEKEIESVTRSKPIDTEIEEIFDDMAREESADTKTQEQNKSSNDPDIVVPIIKSAMKKIVLQMEFSSDVDIEKHNRMMALLIELIGFISVEFDKKDARLTIIGGVDPEEVVALLHEHSYEKADIISVVPAESVVTAERNEQIKSYNPEFVEMTVMESTSRPQEVLKEVVTHRVSGQAIKKIVLEVNPMYVNTIAFNLAQVEDFISFHFERMNGTITFVSYIHPTRLVHSWNNWGMQPYIISVGPAKEHDQNKSYNRNKKFVYGVKSSLINVKDLTKRLSAFREIISVQFNKKQGILTIIGDGTRVLYELSRYNFIEIISMGPAEDHEIEVKPAEEQKKEHKFGPFTKTTSGCSVL